MTIQKRSKDQRASVFLRRKLADYEHQIESAQTMLRYYQRTLAWPSLLINCSKSKEEIEREMERLDLEITEIENKRDLILEFQKEFE